MIHHVGVFASDLPASRAFYTAALRPLGVTPNYQTEDVCEFWQQGQDTPSLSLERASSEPTRGLHLAFTAPDRDAVEAFFEAATAAGGQVRYSPRYWTEYRAYCAFVTDPDGNNIEALHKEVHTPGDGTG